MSKLSKPAKVRRERIPRDVVAYLKTWGFIRDQHYTTALEADAKANAVALELERQRLLRAGAGWVDSGEGPECCGNCRGWDGASATCDCGRYRCSWFMRGTWRNPIFCAAVNWRYIGRASRRQGLEGFAP